MLCSQWPDAMSAADKALKLNGKDYKAMLIKAEALFNLCQFEHALVVFHRGQVSDMKRTTRKKECKFVIRHLFPHFRCSVLTMRTFGLGSRNVNERSRTGCETGPCSSSKGQTCCSKFCDGPWNASLQMATGTLAFQRPVNPCCR